MMRCEGRTQAEKGRPSTAKQRLDSGGSSNKTRDGDRAETDDDERRTRDNEQRRGRPTTTAMQTERQRRRRSEGDAQEPESRGKVAGDAVSGWLF
ncbi:hypothetical protein AAHE18_18G223600 [Arachis hypogaea]